MEKCYYYGSSGIKMQINIAGNRIGPGSKVFIIDYKEQFGFIIEDTEIARVMKMIFEIVWGRWEK